MKNLLNKSNLMLFILVLVVALSCGITAFAQVSSSPDNSNIKYFYSNELEAGLSPESYSNWYEESSWYGKCAVAVDDGNAIDIWCE